MPSGKKALRSTGFKADEPKADNIRGYGEGSGKKFWSVTKLPSQQQRLSFPAYDITHHGAVSSLRHYLQFAKQQQMCQAATHTNRNSSLAHLYKTKRCTSYSKMVSTSNMLRKAAVQHSYDVSYIFSACCWMHITSMRCASRRCIFCALSAQV